MRGDLLFTDAQVLPRRSTLIVLIFGVLRLELRVSLHDRHKGSCLLTFPPPHPDELSHRRGCFSVGSKPCLRAMVKGVGPLHGSKWNP